MTPRSLADDLRLRSEQELGLLLQSRPDLSHPPPRDIAALAARATSGPSLSRCLDTLDSRALQVLAVAAQQSRVEPTTTTAVTEAAAVRIGDNSVAEHSLAHLRTLALIWGPPESLRVVTGVHDLLASLPVSTESSESPLLAEPIAWQERLGDARVPNVDSIGAATARRFVLGVQAALHCLGLQPARALAKGSLSAKDAAQLQMLLDWDPAATALAVELARAARLLTRDTNHLWMPTQRFDSWLAKGVGHRWVSLIAAWLDLPTLPSAEDGAVLDDAQLPGVIGVRRATLGVLAQAPPQTRVDPEGICAVLNFRFPRRRGASRDRMVRACMLEAALLGLVVDGALSGAGHLLVAPEASTDESRRAGEMLDNALPQRAAGFYIQSDLTVIAPGPLAPADELMLRQIGEIESQEPATVARITAQSLIGAVSGGLTMDQVGEFLQQRSLAAVPQALEYLLIDVARRCAADPPPVLTQQRAATPKAPQVRVSRVQDRIPDLARALANTARGSAEFMQPAEIPQVATEPSAEVLAHVRAAIEESQPIWVAFAEADGSRITALVDPIRVESGAVIAMDLAAGRIRTIATARITGTAPQAAAVP